MDISSELSKLSLKNSPTIYNIDNNKYIFNSELTSQEKSDLHNLYNLFPFEEKNILSINKNYLDIGSGFGLYPIKISDKVKTIYTFEPDRLLFNQLCGNIYINNIENILPFNYGLDQYETKTTMNRYLNINPSHEEENKNNLNYEPEPIFLQTLDSFRINNLCLIKINTNELNTLLGGKRTLAINNYPPIIMNKNINNDTIEYLKSLKYEPYNISEFILFIKNNELI